MIRDEDMLSMESLGVRAWDAQECLPSRLRVLMGALCLTNLFLSEEQQHSRAFSISDALD